MNLAKKLLIGGILITSLTSGCYTTTEQSSTGDILGSVYWDPDGDGVFEEARDALVERKGPDYRGGIPPSTKTDRNGNYSFENLEPGFHLLEASKRAYFRLHTGKKEVVVKEGKISHADIFLNPE